MGFFPQVFLIAMALLGIYELLCPVCKKCHGRKRRWHGSCRLCQQGAG